ncbi:unnamed protein product [Blepharisma stoltei]|uniref:Meiosis-specific nuclear structural protein 1 n=1 Tax=Blepharisma stoltei TaxID=1481888 RepID=A0AAU9JBB7_9CILI|nr:unnamed protein product [Blepharisma stoltei]
MSIAGSKKSATSSYMSDQHRQKLIMIKEREDLKGQLITKFLAKYGKRRRLSFIEKEVNNVLNTLPLTEENLRKLDERIGQGSSIAPSASRIESQEGKSIISGISVRTGASQGRMSDKPPESVKSISYMSGASRLSETTAKEIDQKSTVSSVSKISSEALPSDKDEWAVILEYNQAVYREEERKRLERERQQKLSLKRELDRQIEEKKQKEAQERQELQQYIEVQAHNLNDFDQKEAEKARLMKEKILYEKSLRDKQMKDLKRMRRQREKEEKNTDVAMVKRLQEEYKQELQALKNKRIEETHQRKKMLEENLAAKQRQREREELDRLEDIKLQKAHEAMLEKIEQDRLDELRKREERVQTFLNNNANAVLQQQDQMNKDDDRALLQHYMDTIDYDQDEQNRLKARDKEQKKEMRKILEEQMKIKDAKKKREKDVQVRQAQVWKKEYNDFLQMENEEKMKREQLVQMYKDELKQQIKEKKEKDLARMDVIERALNKPLLKQVIETTAPIPEAKLGKR